MTCPPPPLQEEFVAIRLTCCAMNGQGQGLGHSSRGKGLVDLSGWRLIAMGNPTMEFVLYDRAVMPASGDYSSLVHPCYKTNP